MAASSMFSRGVFAAGFFVAGCGGDAPTGIAKNAASPPPAAPRKETPSTKTESSKSEGTKAEHGHSHERGKMLLADAGKHHALLTAHLSKKGNELDVFFETADDKSPTPVALPLTSIKAFANRAGNPETKEIVFTPAPAEERPSGEKAGTCSHFVAKTPWLQPTDELTVAFPLELDGERFRVTWEKFIPNKYAHHVDE